MMFVVLALFEGGGFGACCVALCFLAVCCCRLCLGLVRFVCGVVLVFILVVWYLFWIGLLWLISWLVGVLFVGNCVGFVFAL